MKLPRRQLLHLAVGVAAAPATSRIARAQSHPTRSVHLLVGFAPAGTTDISARLNREINAALADPKNKARIADLGAVPIAMTPTEFGKLIADETERWGKAIRAAHIEVE